MTRTFLLCLWLAVVCSFSAQAQTVRYVSDTLQAPLRAGASERHKILRMVPSGTEVKVLQVNNPAGYTLVQTAEGARGWIPTGQLMDTPSTRNQVAGLQQNLEALKAENADLRQQLNLLSGGSGDMASQLARINEENQRLSQELARLRKLSNSDVKLDEQNRHLEERVVELERELQIARQENQTLVDSRENTLFLAGAGILLLGLILGVVLPEGRARRRDRWREL